MNRLFTFGLRVALVTLFLGAIFAQVWLIPQLSRDIVSDEPEFARLAVPYVILWIAVAVCAQVALFAVWMLLARIGRNQIFSERAFFWVDAIIGAGGLATLLIFGFEIHLLGIEDGGSPPLGILLTGIVTACGAFTLVMLVMRGLLRQATQLQHELEEVV